MKISENAKSFFEVLFIVSCVVLYIPVISIAVLALMKIFNYVNGL